jgi:hypothetical protein
MSQANTIYVSISRIYLIPLKSMHDSPDELLLAKLVSCFSIRLHADATGAGRVCMVFERVSLCLILGIEIM